MGGVVRKPLVDSTQDYSITDPTATSYGDPGGRDPIPPVPVPPPPVVPPPVVPPVVPPPPPPPDPPKPPRTYNPAAGWDVGKLNDPTVHDTKYDFGRAAQEYGTPTRGNLAGLVDFYNQKYGTHAKVAGEDLIDFGENYGPIDVINGENEGLQWVVPGDGNGTSGTGAKGGTATGLLADVMAAIQSGLKDLQPGGGLTADEKVALANKDYSPTGTAGVLDDSAVQQVGQDPLSKTISDAYGNLIKYQEGKLNEPVNPLLTGEDPLSKQTGDAYSDLIKYQQGQLRDPTNVVPYYESARMPYEIARRTQLNNATADLANRGLLSEPGHLQGPEVGSVRRIEEGLAPMYTAAIADRLGALDTLDLTHQTNLGNTLTGSGLFTKSLTDRLGLGTTLNQNQQSALIAALGGGTDRQGMLGDLAIKNLEQNRLWQQFLADNKLDAAKVNDDIRKGKSSDYLTLLGLWLQGANIAAGGFI